MTTDQRARRVRVGVPTHSQTLTTATTELMLRLQGALTARGDVMEYEFYSGAVIADVRNAIVADFLNSGADRLLMLDSDMAAPLAVVLRLIDVDRPVAGCLYPRRQFDWSRVRPLAQGDGRLETALHQAMSFVGMVEIPAGQAAFEVEEGFARAIQVGAGILAIDRAAFQHLMERYPDLASRGFNPGAFPGPRFAQNWGFFNPITPPTGPDLSEDFSFCQRWRDAGGVVWADVASRISHVGVQVYTGSFLEYLDANRPAAS